VDTLLERRYAALVRFYSDDAPAALWARTEVDRPDDFRQLQRLIVPRSHDLRPDATLCLLTLYNEMILRPYRGQLSTLGGDRLPSPSIGRSRDEFFERVEQSLDVIFARLADVTERPISSHQVLRAIDGGWPQLSKIFGWG